MYIYNIRHVCTYREQSHMHRQPETQNTFIYAMHTQLQRYLHTQPHIQNNHICTTRNREHIHSYRHTQLHITTTHAHKPTQNILKHAYTATQKNTLIDAIYTMYPAPTCPHIAFGGQTGPGPPTLCTFLLFQFPCRNSVKIKSQHCVKSCPVEDLMFTLSSQ